MDQKYQLPFKAGQTAEAMSFEVGFRGAWFRCKIQAINHGIGHRSALLEYFYYADEKWTWTELYQVPPYQSGKSKEIRQLMLRPEYPPIHFKSKVSDVSSNTDVTIVVERTWEAGDLVDWWSADCYWSGKVRKLHDNDKAEIELVAPPLCEGATYEVFIKDLHPSLNWSPEFGWAVSASQMVSDDRGKKIKAVHSKKKKIHVNPRRPMGIYMSEPQPFNIPPRASLSATRSSQQS